MKSVKQNRGAVFVLLLVVLLGLTLPTAVAAKSKSGKRAKNFKKSVAGTYLLEVDAPPVNPLFSFNALATLTSDGTMIADSDAGARPTGDVSTTFGVWKNINPRARRVRLRFFLFIIENGVTLSTNRVTATVEFDRKFNEFEGDFVIEVFLPGQDPLGDEEPLGGAVPGFLTARRIRP